MAWINVHFFDTIEAVKAWLLINLMVPFKRLLLGLPWLAVVAAAGARRLAAGRLAARAPRRRPRLFIALNGQWVNAMETVYLCGISVLIACAIGIPIGIWRRATSAPIASSRRWSTRCRRCRPSPI